MTGRIMHAEDADGGLIDQLREQWISAAIADGRDGEAEALLEHDDQADAEDELLAGFRRDVELAFAVNLLREEPETSTW
jgi:hypothetical protein